jgi:predicted O-methyltransferase YrrM
MNALIDRIYDSGLVRSRDGREYPLIAAIDPREGAFLRRLISEDETICRTLEIGCAYGLSSLHICESLMGRPGARHTMIDPNQNSEFHGVGVHHLEQLGFRDFELIEKPSEIALPELLAQNEDQFDFIFVDGWHTFDHALLDCFYANRLLRVGGLLVLDDAAWNTVSRVIDYLEAYPHLQRYGQVETPRVRTPLELVAGCFLKLVPSWPRMKIFHPRFCHKVFDDSIDEMVALKKTGRDERSWDWFPQGF